MRQQKGFATAQIFQALEDGNQFGLDVMRTTGLASGTVYPTLTRAEAAGLVRAKWEAAAPAAREGRPRRRYYELTTAGRAALESALQRFGALAAAPRRADR